MLDINIWLNRFSRGNFTSTTEWELPELPYPLPASEFPDTTNWILNEVWQLEQTRELGA
jgi:hypothetical protein